jgi:hypothetical protein
MVSRMTARRGNRGHDGPSAIDSIDPPRNFTITTEERMRALAIGAPAYAERKKRIEDADEAWHRTLVDLADSLFAAGAPEAEVLAKLRARAARFDFARINKLVATHNRYYPIEANLPMDRAGNYLLFGKPFQREEPFDVERVVFRALASIRERESERDDATP